MSLPYTVTKITFNRQGFFLALFAGNAPWAKNLGNVIGYANKAQLSADLKAFVVSNIDDGLQLTPKLTPPDMCTKSMLKDACAMLQEIGFNTSAVEMKEPIDDSSAPETALPAAMTTRRSRTPGAKQAA